jgi:hypothetical protein
MRFVPDDPDRLSCREQSLLYMLEREYTPTLARSILVPLIEQTSPVSLRALDWAVVNWSKQHNVVCASASEGQMTNVHHSYRCALGHWKRRLFDPFRRRARVRMVLDADEEFETTLGQANFVIWTYKTGVLNYVAGHLDEIERDMNTVSQRQKRLRRETRKCGGRHRRGELTQRTTALCVAYMAPERIKFV